MIEKHMLGKLEVANRAYAYEGIMYKGAEFIIHLPTDVK